MLPVYATALLILLASLGIGRALLHGLGWRQPTPLAGAIGFAALITAAPLVIRLPGRGLTAAVLVGIALLASLGYLHRAGVLARPSPVGIATVVVVLAAASLPFVLSEHTGVLGEGIYTNDHAAQLYWTDWLQNGFGPEPSAVQWGYPTGPQSLVAAVAEGTGINLIDAFNGLLLAVPALTALAALAALGGLSPVRRAAAASLAGLPYLAASFLAQSAFKETVMALLLLAFVLVLAATSAEWTKTSPMSTESSTRPDGPSRRAAGVSLLVLAAAAVFTFSLPGLAWFAALLPAWLVLEVLFGRRPLPLDEIRKGIRRHRLAIGALILVAVAVAVVSVGRLGEFVDRVGDVQASAGRLDSPIFPGEALGVWPEGDFRLVRGEVEGAILATAFALLAVAAGALVSLRRRESALLAGLGAGAAVYVGARLFAEIHVEAKALAVVAPLVILVAGRGLLASEGPRPLARQALGALFVACAALSTFLALRTAPVGFDDRGRELERLADGLSGERVAFLGVDRFAGYWLRDTLMESPGGYVPNDVRAREEKTWQQGRAMDLDTLKPGRLDDYDYAITTSAAFQSTPPPNLEEYARSDSFVVWERTGPTPPTAVLPDEGGSQGAILDCDTDEGRRLSRQRGVALTLPRPVTGDPLDWSRRSPFPAPDDSSQALDLGKGFWQISLQYHSQAELTVEAPGLRTVKPLPPSLDGMYLTHPGQGSYWYVGEVEVKRQGPVTITIRPGDPPDLPDALGAERRVWLGAIAATRSNAAPREVPLADACGRYVDRYALGSRPARG